MGVGCHREAPTQYAATNASSGMCTTYKEKEPRARNRIVRTVLVGRATDVDDTNIQISAAVAMAKRKSNTRKAKCRADSCKATYTAAYREAATHRIHAGIGSK